MLSIVALCLKCGFDRDLALIIASLAGLLATLKIYWIRLKNFLYTIKKKINK